MRWFKETYKVVNGFQTLLVSDVAFLSLQLISLLWFVFFIQPASALQPEPVCRRGEYVLTVSSVSALKKQALDDASEAVAQGVEMLQTGKRSMLILDNGEARTGKRGLDLCGKLRAKRRTEVVSERESGRPSRSRSYSCSCNAEISALKVPNDPFFNLQWGLSQPNGVDLGMPAAWEKSTGSSNVIVAVVDTGIDYNHEDLRDNMWVNSSEIAGNGMDDDGNGIIDDVYGFNALTNTGNPMDDNGHGSHVAGIIGARGSNSKGLSGVNWQVKMMAVKFLAANGSGSLYGAIQGIDYITAMKERGENVVVSNNSWGGAGFEQPLYDAILRAKNAGIIFVAAAGNSTNDNDSNPSYPASFDLENVISVAAVDSNGNLASFSNFGASSVDIAAPGVDIASTYVSNQYVYLSGTSMAVPHVSGALALLAAYHPELSWQEMQSLLFSSARPLGSLEGIVKSGAMVDVAALLSASDLPPVVTPQPTTPPPTQTQTPVPTVSPTPPVSSPTVTPTPAPPVLPGPYSVGGQLYIQTGSNLTPAAGARIRITTDQGTFLRVADSGGRFNFAGIVLAPTDYELTVSLDGWKFESRSGTLNGDLTLSLTGTAPAVTVSGVVINKDKLPLGGVMVDGGSLGSVTTDSSGRFSFNAQAGFEYGLAASVEGYAFENPQVSGMLYGNVERVFVAFPG